MPDHLLQLVNLLLVPMVGLLWRISTQIAELSATQKHHGERLDRIEDRKHP